MLKTALLVGISGLGRTLHRPLAALGYKKCIITYRNDETAATQWKAEASALGIESTIYRLDSTNPTEVNSVVSKIDRLDAVIAMQGRFIVKAPLDYTPEEIQATFASNYFANYYLAQTCLPKLRIVNGSMVFFGVAHADQLHSQPMTTAYAASKTALLVLMRSLARTEAPHNVRINMISPGIMQNGKMPLDEETKSIKTIPTGRIGTPDDIAGAVRYFLSDDSKYVTGTNIIVSGGWAI
jgi:3-oxoacyl-[acyl-carrier protein] reductase